MLIEFVHLFLFSPEVQPGDDAVQARGSGSLVKPKSRKAPYKYRNVRVGKVTRLEHRLVVEQALGRRLDRLEVVHHKNGNGRDNRLVNLEVMSLSDHTRHHRHGVPLLNETKAKIREALVNRRPKNAPLSDAVVRQIRSLRLSGLGPTAIAKKFGILKVTVIGIVKGRRYAYVA